MAPSPGNAPARLIDFASRLRSNGSGKRTVLSADVVLAALVIAIVALMIVPLPTPVLDILLAANLSLAVSILLVVLYVSDAVAIATFPTLLLLTTLFRLSLNVASTRLILVQANAGEVIRSFGTFVVKGNYVVGFVVFSLLTLIQFIVVAKGSERVAEVGARFALDAMPGKQMAIDAELRSGGIDADEAKVKRRALGREGQFYGAMDGAMKFVKGDVIASTFIIAINLLGGLAIGVGQKGMPIEAALRKYGLLTIGDGLVTQIPALILSTAAGVLVTRVASEATGASLGEELSSQLLRAPKALRAASFMVLAFAAVPGLPGAPFLVIGCALLALSYRRESELGRQTDVGENGTGGGAFGGEPAFVPVVVPWSVHVGLGLASTLDAPQLRRNVEPRGSLRSQLVSVRRSMFDTLGVPLPPPQVIANSRLASREVRISFFEIQERTLLLPEMLDEREAITRIADASAAAVRRRASDFIGLAATQKLLDELEKVSPATVRNVVPKPISVVLLADVLRRLAEEHVPIRDLGAILEALSAAPSTERDPLALSEYVRGHLRRVITHQVVSEDGRLRVWTIDPNVEEVIRKSISRSHSGMVLAIAPHSARDIVSAFARALAPVPLAASNAVVLTQPDVRRVVRKLVETDAPDIHVITAAELLPETKVEPLGRITLLD